MLWWEWWILGGVLIVIEALTPGFVMLWLGLAAMTTGLIQLLLPGLGWEWQLLLFGLLAVASVVGWVAWRRRQPQDAPGEPALNRRGEANIGRTATLTAAIVNGSGRIRLDDTSWLVTGPDLPAGSTVLVVGASSNRLQVAPAEPPPIDAAI